MKKIILGLVLACMAWGATATEMEEHFRDIPVKARPWAYWWWLNGHVDKETITRDLEAMRRVGFGGLLMFDARGYHDDTRHVVMPPPAMEFMSDEWRALLKFGIQEAARVGLEVSVNLSSCAGALKGPWPVGADAPKRLIFQTVPLAGGAALETVLKRPELKHYWDVALFAVKYDGSAITNGVEWLNAGDGVYTMKATSGKRIDGQQEVQKQTALEVVDLTGKADAQGRLAWQVPEGQWALVRFGYTTIDGHEYDVDVLDPKAVEGHFNRMGKAILADAGPLAGKTLTHFYSVSWEGAVPTWTGDFEQEFRKYRGYAIRAWLPVMAGFTVKSEAASQAFVTDYRRARNDCFRDNFYGTLMRLSHANGLKWHAESGGPWVRSPAVFGEADQLAFLARTDMPQGEFWYTGSAGRTGRQLSRAPANTAHIYGKRLAAVEAFTHMTYHWTPYPAILKRSGDEAFIDGANHLVWHTFTCSPKKFGMPGSEYFAGTHINPNVTWFEQAKPFLSYLGRCQYLLQQGLFVADVCTFTGDVPYQHWGRYTTKWSDRATMELPQGHGYDVVNSEVLLERASVKHGDIVLPDSMSYRVLVVDLEEAQVSLPALRKIEELKTAGAAVVFGKRLPLKVPGKAADAATHDAEVQKLGKRLWTGSPTLEQALKAKNLIPDFEGPFEYTHRRDGQTDIYFVVGTGKGECRFRVKGMQPELWDPVTGKMIAVKGWQSLADGRTSLTLELPEQGSLFVLFRKPGQPGPAAAPAVITGEIALTNAWEVSFMPGRGAPEKAVFDTLIDWAQHTDKGIKYFSGTATYCKTVEITAAQAGCTAWLELGNVAALAQVRLNGNDLGIVWTAPWKAELTGVLRAGKNELEIEVTNPWANRLVGDAALPPEERITQCNLQYEKGKRTLKNFQGYASADLLQPSGLMGPVRITFNSNMLP